MTLASETMPDRSADRRYGAVSITLHWVIALLIIGQIAGGLAIGFLIPSGSMRGTLIGLHKSIGLTVLALSLLRLGVRIGHPAPPLPPETPGWQRLLARATQVGFYVLMIGMPLTGWLLSSTGSRPLQFFGLFDVPKIGLVTGRRDLHDPIETWHLWLALTATATLALHVAGALKHQIIDRDIVFWRMAPWLRRPIEPKATEGATP